MSAVNIVNPGADLVRGCDATMMNINAARGLYDVLKSNLGPKGTLKMLVGGAGDLKLTKDGNTLLHEMMIQHPTAALIARIATAQDDVAGDGTTSNVLIIGDLMKQSERYLADGLHPRLICEGIQAAKSRVLEFLDKVKTDVPVGEREFLIKVAASSLRTKLHAELADLVTEIVVDAVRCVKKEGEQLDLHMVEIMSMQHRHAAESRLVRGLVMDHGGRHPDMKKTQNNCFILTCNATLEYEKSEVNSGFMYSNADQREKMLAAERKWVDDRVQLVLALKAKQYIRETAA
ncbi:chaperonin Cpn60/TCP-1 family [Pavlovales sp. CCMP2436]|nr:chaperonin Cpn60/TCP-1 family [Pavlovales sp. CCMP2436]